MNETNTSLWCKTEQNYNTFGNPKKFTWGYVVFIDTTREPSPEPTSLPSLSPSPAPSGSPTIEPTNEPSVAPSKAPVETAFGGGIAVNHNGATSMACNIPFTTRSGDEVQTWDGCITFEEYAPFTGSAPNKWDGPVTEIDGQNVSSNYWCPVGEFSQYNSDPLTTPSKKFNWGYCQIEDLDTAAPSLEPTTATPSPFAAPTSSPSSEPVESPTFRPTQEPIATSAPSSAGSILPNVFVAVISFVILAAL